MCGNQVFSLRAAATVQKIVRILIWFALAIGVVLDAGAADFPFFGHHDQLVQWSGALILIVAQALLIALQLRLRAATAYPHPTTPLSPTHSPSPAETLPT